MDGATGRQAEEINDIGPFILGSAQRRLWLHHDPAIAEAYRPWRLGSVVVWELWDKVRCPICSHWVATPSGKTHRLLDGQGWSSNAAPVGSRSLDSCA